MCGCMHIGGKALHLLPCNFTLVLVRARARDAAAEIADFPFAVAALQNVLYLFRTRAQ